MDEPQDLYRDESLNITHVPGTSGSAIIAFAGIGLRLGGIPIREFSNALDGTPHDVYHVIEIRRHWYLGVEETIRDVLNQHLEQRRNAHAVCLGNSMGGFGALYFARLIRNCTRAIAFGPQSSVNATLVPWEGRWQEWRATMPPGEGLDLVGNLDPDISYRVTMGLGDRRDVLHLERLLENAPASLVAVSVEGSGHSVAAHLKHAGAFRGYLAALLEGRDADAIAALGNLPHEIRTGAGRPDLPRRTDAGPLVSDASGG
jgi:pimeloyl-ACP methyl ester carboxylesterase